MLTPGGRRGARRAHRRPSTSSSARPAGTPQPERFRLHAVATQRAADRLARELDYEDRDELLCSALLHDIGKLVLIHAYPGYPGQIHGEARTPEERVHRERRELGVDHALVGGVLARRWGLPNRLATAIERHHSDEAEGEAALIRLADMLAHYGHGQPVDPAQLLKVAARLDLSHRPAALGDVRASHAGQAPSATSSPCPLSTREVEVLKRLAEGKVYKQIALELEPLDEHGAHAPAQHVREARRGRPRPGRSDRHRARLDLAPARGPSRPFLAGCSRSRACRGSPRRARACSRGRCDRSPRSSPG